MHYTDSQIWHSRQRNREVLDKYHVTALHAYFAGNDDLVQHTKCTIAHPRAISSTPGSRSDVRSTVLLILLGARQEDREEEEEQEVLRRGAGLVIDAYQHCRLAGCFVCACVAVETASGGPLGICGVCIRRVQVQRTKEPLFLVFL